MKPTQQYFHMEDTIHLCVVLWTKNCGVSIHIKPLWPSFCTVLFSSLDFLKRNLAYLCLSLRVGGRGVRVKAALGIFCDFSFFLLGPIRTNGDKTKGGQGSIGIIVERGGG